MINVIFMGNTVSMNETILSLCAVEYNISLEVCFQEHFNPYARNGENIKRELKEALGRDATTEEIESLL